MEATTGRPAEESPRAQAFARLTAETCASSDARLVCLGCAALREAVLEECAQGGLTLDETRAICRSIDDAQAEALDRAAVDGDAARQLRDALHTFEVLVETSPLPIVSLDRDGLVRTWNRAAEELFGWGRDEMLGKAPAFVPEDQAGESRAMMAEALAGGVFRDREVRRVRKDGTALELSLSVGPLRNGQGEVDGCILILADITDRKRRERETEETARFREHFVGVVGHDLRNPLTAIITSAQLLLRYGRLDEPQQRVVNRVASSAGRMARMIADLLDFARTRLGGGFPIHTRRLDLRELTGQTVEELIFAHPERTVHIDAEGDFWGNWDPGRMEQVVSNLVGNALQHGPVDCEVTVTLHGEAEVVVLSTHNAGPPIPAEALLHVFEPGQRGAPSGGLGLGLFIVQQIVLAHGGSIEASSGSEGTTFTAVLPRKARANVYPRGVPDPIPISSQRYISREGRSNLVKVGLRRAFFGDLYASWLTSSWRRVLALVVALYLLINAFFALLYLTLGGIENARPGSFADAFFFSVQTIATIGYGKMSPVTLPAHLLVTFESFCGLVGVALITGLMFAKFARPSARVLWSDVCVVAPAGRRPVLDAAGRQRPRQPGGRGAAARRDDAVGADFRGRAGAAHARPAAGAGELGGLRAQLARRPSHRREERALRADRSVAQGGGRGALRLAHRARRDLQPDHPRAPLVQC